MVCSRNPPPPHFIPPDKKCCFSALLCKPSMKAAVARSITTLLFLSINTRKLTGLKKKATSNSRLSRGNSFAKLGGPPHCLVPSVGGGEAGAGMSPQLSRACWEGRGTECWGPQIWCLKGRATRQGHKTSAFWASHEIYVHPCWHVTALEEAGEVRDILRQPGNV